MLAGAREQGKQFDRELGSAEMWTRVSSLRVLGASVTTVASVGGLVWEVARGVSPAARVLRGGFKLLAYQGSSHSGRVPLQPGRSVARPGSRFPTRPLRRGRHGRCPYWARTVPRTGPARLSFDGTSRARTNRQVSSPPDVDAVVYGHVRTLLEEEGVAADSLRGTSTLESLGVDSLALAVLLVRLEDDLGVDPLSGSDRQWPTDLDGLVHCYREALCSAS